MEERKKTKVGDKKAIAILLLKEYIVHMSSSTTPAETQEKPVTVAMLLTPAQIVDLKVAVARHQTTMQKLVTRIVLEKLPSLSEKDLT